MWSNVLGREKRARGFTLVELLVVLVIIGIVSVVVLGTVLPALRTRASSEAGRILQGALVGARDQAIHSNKPSGIRLLPDPAYPYVDLKTGLVDPNAILAFNRAIPIAAAPDYSEGRISVYDDGAGGSSQYPAAIRTVNGQLGVPCLVIEQAVNDQIGLPNSPTSWFWNIRVGEQIQIKGAGPWYTIVGPMVTTNPELFVNIGPPGTALPVLQGGTPCEYLLLVNGRDDGKMVGQVNAPPGPDGWIDSGWDGVDNNGDGIVDDGAEWEVERWIGG